MSHTITKSKNKIAIGKKKSNTKITSILKTRNTTCLGCKKIE